MQILPFGDGLGQTRAGATFGLAMSGPARDPRAPEIPTFAELRIGSTLMNSFSLWAPAGLPVPVGQRLAQAIGEPAAGLWHLPAHIILPIFAKPGYRHSHDNHERLPAGWSEILRG